MSAEISAWIALNKHRWIGIMGTTRGQCKRASEDLVAQFPELKLVPGTVILFDGSDQQHWWTEDPDGNTIDPTAEQFYIPVMIYEPWEGPLPIGKCCNCGRLCLVGAPSKELCSTACERSYTAYVNGDEEL